MWIDYYCKHEGTIQSFSRYNRYTLLLLFNSCFVCLGFFFHSTIFYLYMNTSPVKGYKFRPMLGTYGHWADMVLLRFTPTQTHEIHLKWSSPKILLPSVWHWSCHYLFITSWVCHWWVSNTQSFPWRANALADCVNAAQCLFIRVCHGWIPPNALDLLIAGSALL